MRNIAWLASPLVALITLQGFAAADRRDSADWMDGERVLKQKSNEALTRQLARKLPRIRDSQDFIEKLKRLPTARWLLTERNQATHYQAVLETLVGNSTFSEDIELTALAHELYDAPAERAQFGGPKRRRAFANELYARLLSLQDAYDEHSRPSLSRADEGANQQLLRTLDREFFGSWDAKSFRFKVGLPALRDRWEAIPAAPATAGSARKRELPPASDDPVSRGVTPPSGEAKVDRTGLAEKISQTVRAATARASESDEPGRAGAVLEAWQTLQDGLAAQPTTAAQSVREDAGLRAAILALARATYDAFHGQSTPPATLRQAQALFNATRPYLPYEAFPEQGRYLFYDLHALFNL